MCRRAFCRRLLSSALFLPVALPADSPLIGLDNVVLAPHCLAWTDEMSIGNGSSAIRAILAVRDGGTPQFVVNRQVLA